MSMEKITKKNAVSKSELHCRLREWLNTEEPQIGPEGIHEQTAWLHVRDGHQIFKFDPDTKRAAVEEYLGLVELYGDNIAWVIVPNQRGKMNAVAFGPEVRSLNNRMYLYLISES